MIVLCEEEAMENHKNINSLLKSMRVDRFQKCDDFHLLKFKDHIEDIPFQTHSRQCDFFQIYFSKEYDVEVLIDDLAFSGKDKTLVAFLAPHQILSVDVKAVQPIATGYMLSFHASFLNRGWSDFDVQQQFPYFNLNYSPFYFLEAKQSIYQEIFDKMYVLFRNLSADNLEIIRSYLNILLFESRKSFFNGSIKNKLQSRCHELAFSFESLIRKHAHTRNALDFYASQLNISTVYLSECVKKATAKTAKQIINEYTILEAITRLTQSADTIDQIADKLGFTASSNFINFFKKHMLQTPSAYRKNVKT